MSPDLLQWMNLLLVPMAWHMVRVGERVAHLEASVAMMLREVRSSTRQ